MGIGESLTSEEAMTRVETEMEEERKKEEEKLERKRKREEKRKQKDKSKGTKRRRSTCTSSTEPALQSRAICKECHMYYNTDDGEWKWIECKQCRGWVHAACVGMDEEESDGVEFVCDTCTG